MPPEILFEKRGAVFVVTFNRADKENAFTAYMAAAIQEKLKTIADDRGTRAILFCGQGAHFMNGHDLYPYTGDMNMVQDQVLQKVQSFYNVIRELQNVEKPVICAVHGRVTGAAFNFMLASDLVIAAKSAVFNASFAPYALVPDGGITSLLPRKLGIARAAELLMLNDDITAAQARDWGLITRLADDADLQTQAAALAENLAQGPTRMLGATKRLLAKAFDQDLNAQLSLEANFWNANAKTFDFREAMKAFAAKRPVKFTGS